MQNWQKYYCFCLNMTHFAPIFFSTVIFYFFFILHTYLNYIQVQTFFLKIVFYLINLNATQYDFWYFLTISDFLLTRGGGGGLDPSIFGWHTIWTAPYWAQLPTACTHEEAPGRHFHFPEALTSLLGVIADPGKARGCFTNSLVINSVTQSAFPSHSFTAPPRPNCLR